MTFKSKLKIESVGMFAASVFYALVGITFFAVLAISDFRLIHVGLIGILSLVTAYGLFKKRAWALWVVVALFFIATTFAVSMLYYIFGIDIFIEIGIIVYLILTWVFTAYITAKRKMLES
ncbi:MAG: hypothetical protein QXH37_04745 [Candidatus Bathyarchaeia archaeon]